MSKIIIFFEILLATNLTDKIVLSAIIKKKARFIINCSRMRFA